MLRKVTSPDMIRFVKQSGFHGDCAVASIAMLCGVLYEDALAAFDDPLRILQDGVTWPKMIAAADRLGVKVYVRRRYDVTEATGILNVENPKTKEEHLVTLWEGRIVDGNGELWLDSQVYLRHYHYRAKSLLVVEEGKE